jgi:hypothetical protein
MEQILESIHVDLVVCDSLTLEVYFRRKEYDQPTLEGSGKNTELNGPRFTPITIERVFLCRGGASKIDISEIHVSDYLDIDMRKLKNDIQTRIL